MFSPDPIDLKRALGWTLLVTALLALVVRCAPSARALETHEVDLGFGGVYDGAVVIARDGAGRMIFTDAETGAPVTLGELRQPPLVTDHAELLNLDADDHPHYALADGSRAFDALQVDGPAQFNGAVTASGLVTAGSLQSNGNVAMYNTGNHFLNQHGVQSGSDGDYAKWITYNDGDSGTYIHGRRIGANNSMGLTFGVQHAGSIAEAARIQPDRQLRWGNPSPDASNDDYTENHVVDVSGAKLTAGGTWTNSSSAQHKLLHTLLGDEHTSAALGIVRALPVYLWEYKAQEDRVRMKDGRLLTPAEARVEYETWRDRQPAPELATRDRFTDELTSGVVTVRVERGGGERHIGPTAEAWAAALAGFAIGDGAGIAPGDQAGVLLAAVRELDRRARVAEAERDYLAAVLQGLLQNIPAPEREAILSAAGPPPATLGD